VEEGDIQKGITVYMYIDLPNAVKIRITYSGECMVLVKSLHTKNKQKQNRIEQRFSKRRVYSTQPQQNNCIVNTL